MVYRLVNYNCSKNSKKEVEYTKVRNWARMKSKRLVLLTLNAMRRQKLLSITFQRYLTGIAPSTTITSLALKIAPLKRNVFYAILKYWQAYLSNYLYNWGHCDQTHPRRSDTDSKSICHFDPLLMQIEVSYMAF